MYNSHFGFSESPFSISPDPSFLYLSQRHREALAHLIYGAGENGGFVLLTGEVGTGKTTLIRAMLTQNMPGIDVALCLHSGLTVLDFMAAILDELHIPKPSLPYSLKPLIDALNQYLLASHARGRQTVLIIDEAQNLSREVLEQIRLLTNLETDSQKLLRIILVGQEELLEMIERDDLRQLSQRITVRYHLTALNKKETKAYISHRLETAGGSPLIFSAGAVKMVYQLTKGTPRLMNVLCDRALLTAYNQGQHLLMAKHIRQAAKEVFSSNQRVRQKVNRQPIRWFGYEMLTALLLAGFCFYVLVELVKKENHPVTDKVSESLESSIVPKVSRETLPLSTDSPFLQPDENKEKEQEPVGGLTANHVTEAVANSLQMSGSLQSPVASSAKKNLSGPAADSVSSRSKAPVIKTIAMPINSQSQTGHNLSEQTINSGQSSVGSKTIATIANKASTRDGVEQLTVPVVERDDNSSVLTADSIDSLSINSLSVDELWSGSASEFSGLLFLAKTWSLETAIAVDKTLCESMEHQGMTCVSLEGGFPLLATVNRPALLEITSGRKQSKWLPITAMLDKALQCELNEQTDLCPLATVAQAWSGRLRLLLKKPRVSVQIRPGFTGEQVRWLRQRIAIAEGKDFRAISNSLQYDRSLVTRVKQFQSNYGLIADGIVGDNTVLFLYNVVTEQQTPVLKTTLGR